MNTRKRAVLFLTVLVTFVAFTFVILPDNVSASSKYSNPIKTFKIGKKNYAKYYKKGAKRDYKQWTIQKRTIKKKRLVIKPRKGWVVKSIWIEYPKGWGVVGKKLKNKHKFSIPKKTFYLEVTLKHKKSGRKVTRVLRTKGY